jgi:hypothetical protein
MGSFVNRKSAYPNRPLIFLSYRREDPTRVKELLYEKLVRLLPGYEIFRDQQSISPASDYQASLINAVLRAQLVLTLVDEFWHSNWCRDANAVVVDNPDDWVFRELQTALYHNIPVLPVIIHPSREPTIVDVPPSLQEICFRQGVTFYPAPDPDGSALKVADAIHAILPAKRQLVRNTLFAVVTFAALVLLGVFGAQYIFNDINQLEYQRFEKEVVAMNLRKVSPTTEHRDNAVTATSLGQPDYSQFLILSDDREWDLRGFRVLSPSDAVKSSYVVLNRSVRIVKQVDIDEITFEGRTTGGDLILESPSHPERSIEYMSTVPTQVAGVPMKVRQLKIDVSDAMLGEEVSIRIRSTFWDSLQEPSDWWVGSIGYAGADYVRMLVLFPDTLPYVSYRLESAPNTRDPAKPYRGRSEIYELPSRNAIVWKVSKPEAGYVYRLAWDWKKPR